jgi:hypothetical protein
MPGSATSDTHSGGVPTTYNEVTGISRRLVYIDDMVHVTCTASDCNDKDGQKLALLGHITNRRN